MAQSRKTDPNRNRTQRYPESPVSRRKFIQGAVVASAAAGAAALPTNAHGGASPTPVLDAPQQVGAGEAAAGYKILTAGQGLVLAAVLNRIIPASDAMPGAGDVRIAKFIDGVLVDAPHLRPRVMAVLNAVDFEEPFVGLSAAEQDARLKKLARHKKEAFDTLLQVAYTGYYSEPRVLAAIGWNPGPDLAGPPEPFDTRLLDAVRKRGPIYREA